MSPRTALASLADPGLTATLALFQNGAELTRAEVATRTGWARVTVTARMERLLEDGLLEPYDERNGGRGRPAARYRLAVGSGVLLVADVGATGMRLARCDLAGKILATDSRDSAIGDGPDEVLGIVRQAWKALMRGSKGIQPWGVAIGLPGPVEYPRGRVVDPPIMTGWDGFEVSEAISGWYDTVAHAENDANALAVGELAAAAEAGSPISDLLVVKVGTGVGAGIISGGRVLRGAAGAAGDIGHTDAENVSGHDDITGRGERPICRCGKVGCVEAYAGGWALVRDAADRGLDVKDVQSFLQHLSQGDPIARALTAESGRVIGSAIATAVSLLNPERVVIGGALGLTGDHLVAGVRERVYARSPPLATRSLGIDRSRLGHDAGVRGLAHELSRKVLLGTSASA
jgi:predicted NBD/HSP70 family sugar kinase